MSEPLPKEYVKICEFRDKMVRYCTKGERRIDLGVSLGGEYIKDKIVSDKDKKNGIEYKLHAYATAEFIIEKSKEDQMVDLIDAYLENTDINPEKAGFYVQYGKYQADLSDDMEYFIYAVEAQKDDYQRIKFPLSRVEEAAVDERESIREARPGLDINKKLYDADTDEIFSTKATQIPSSMKRH